MKTSDREAPINLSSKVPERYETERLVLLKDDELKRWIPEEASLYWKVLLKDDLDRGTIGDLEVSYAYDRYVLRVGNVALHAGDLLNHGYGKELYRAVPTMVLPSGELFNESTFNFVTSHHSNAANRVWESFVNSGRAVRVDEVQRSYRWNKNK